MWAFTVQQLFIFRDCLGCEYFYTSMQRCHDENLTSEKPGGQQCIFLNSYAKEITRLQSSYCLEFWFLDAVGFFPSFFFFFNEIYAIMSTLSTDQISEIFLLQNSGTGWWWKLGNFFPVSLCHKRADAKSGICLHDKCAALPACFTEIGSCWEDLLTNLLCWHLTIFGYYL